MQSSKNMLSQKSNSNLKKSSRGKLIYNKNNSKSSKLFNDKFIFYEKNNTSTKAKKSKTKFVKSNQIMNFNLKTEKSDERKQKINLIKNILTDSFDESDFDDVLNGEQRTYCQYFTDVFINNQIFINAFCIHEILRPRSLKLLILIMTIELYFVITALFYNEEYLSELFNSSEKDTFFSFVPRRVNQFIYTSAVSGIISYLIGYFFIEEGKIKRIFRRNKEDSLKIKYEISQLMKNIEKKFMILLFFSIILSIVCFVYIACFNIVYPYIRFEWIKSSIFILILMQALNLLFSFIHCCLRYLGVCCNNEKIFELSLFLA